MKKYTIALAFALAMFGPKICPAAVSATAQAATVTAVVEDANTVVAEGITVKLSVLRDGNGFDVPADVTAQQDALSDAKQDMSANESVSTVSAVCSHEFYTVWAAAQWNNFAFHIISNNGALVDAARYLKIAQAILDVAPASSDKDSVQKWINNNTTYVNTTHLESHKVKHVAKASLKVQAANEKAAESASNVPTQITK